MFAVQHFKTEKDERKKTVLSRFEHFNSENMELITKPFSVNIHYSFFAYSAVGHNNKGFIVMGAVIQLELNKRASESGGGAVILLTLRRHLMNKFINE